jgi:hypothetical protein
MVEKIINLRSTRIFPHWDWQFHILGKEDYLPSLHCFGKCLHATRTKYKYFPNRD